MKKNRILILILFCCVLFSSSVIASTLTIRPSSQGSYTDWLNIGCSSGTGEWDCVNENPVNNLDYLYAYTANNKESFNFEDINLTSEQIYGIELVYNAKRYSLAKYYFWPLFKINGTDFIGSSLYCSSNYALKSQWVDKNPLTNNPWTVSEINNLEAGMKLQSYSNAGAYISQMYINVDYDSPEAYPDLNISSIGFSEYTNGTSLIVSVYATVKNNGLDSADASTTRLQGLSSEDRSTSMLRSKQSQGFSWNYDCTEPHNFTITADSNEVVTESDETNNIKTVYIDCAI